MATLVSVRELKDQAPRFVQRAARGERFLITRYGKVQARLEPISEEPLSVAAQRHGARMAAWERERRAFAQLRPRLVHRFWGRFVAVRGGRVIDSDPDHAALFDRLWAGPRGRSFFLGWVGEPPPHVELPSFTVE
jgi:antitoxin (DNA-binding transcriptional repressor) of toxin-antitoxin stability system